MQRVEAQQVQAMIEASKPAEPAALTPAPPAATGWLSREPIAAQIDYADFAKIDLRVAKLFRLRPSPVRINYCA